MGLTFGGRYTTQLGDEDCICHDENGAPHAVTLTYGTQRNPFYDENAPKEPVEIDMDTPARGNLILTSQGLNTQEGAALIAKELDGEDLSSKSILLVLLNRCPPHSIQKVVVQACENMGFQRGNIFYSDDLALPETVDYIYVTEGNTFSILHHLRRERSTPKSKALIPYIRRNVANGATYIGASAGAMLAGVDIALALEFDKNCYTMTDFTALGLFQGSVIPHYTEEELGFFIANSTEEELAGYEQLYSVANDEVLRL
ncbi:Type 1 glutamine amidotransferase-like domain-containing protein [Bengtsoniella intestinalis]|uniref:Type 1 glutamine amidotransferase-like domain-containing protein n=1 Tax=Bengtsoniella intestinalis TaxID=3073143 RepID=UPI00391F0A38